jgi:hypothetical protein
MSSRRLIAALSTTPPPMLMVGEVTAVTGTTLTALVMGESVPGIPRLDSYSPTVGDSVLLARGRSRLYALGKVA